MTFAGLIESIKILSLEPEGQESYLKDIGLLRGDRKANLLRNIDELALQFEDNLLGFERYIEDSSLSEELVASILAVDRKLSNMSETATDDLWTVAGLFESADWSQVRELARRVLKEIELR